jgi:cytochrome b subunit of formate dehydrogenase
MATSRQELAARSVSSAATITTRSQSDASPTESTLNDYNYQTSKIVRIAIVSGVIVLVITGIVLFFKVSLTF